jgi:hypothetical protein
MDDPLPAFLEIRTFDIIMANKRAGFQLIHLKCTFKVYFNFQ